MVICLEQGVTVRTAYDLLMVQMIPLPPRHVLLH